MMQNPDSQAKDHILKQLHLAKTLLKSQTKLFAESFKHSNASFSRQEWVAGEWINNAGHSGSLSLIYNN